MARKRAPAVLPARVVGIGASAGGLDPLRRMIGRTRADTGNAFVVIQHRARSPGGDLTKLLAAITSMSVVEADGGPLEPNTIYVVPPHSSGTLRGDLLVVEGLRRGASSTHVIDELFASLAEALGERAVGIVLSGTGNDGTAGLRAIRDGGGLGCAQDPSSAAYDEMPRNAIAAGLADVVLPPEELADELGLLGTVTPRAPHAKDAAATPPTDRILEQLREASGIDFTSYKRTTIERRLARRLAAHDLSSLADYSAYLEEHPEEAAEVYEDLLIHVTEFFRDGTVLETLITRALPELLRDKPADAPIRVWVPGCSTGEELYSIAILLLERLGDDRPIQMFGSDLSEKAIDTARRGTYPASVASQVGEERFARFFVRDDDRGYRIKKEVRERCVFVRHDLVVDPPFSKLDIISCRNVFIYLGPPLQKRVLPIFHYALQQPGFLLLGRAESIAGFEQLFATVDAEARLYVRKPAARHVITFSAAGQLGRQPWRRTGDTTRSALDVQRDVDHLLLARYGPPCVLVNEQFEVVNFRGRTSLYLEQPPGQPQLNVLRLAREGIGAELAIALERAHRTEKSIRRENLTIGERGARRTIDLEVIPLRGTVDAKRHFLIVFEEVPTRVREAAPTKRTKKRRVSDEVLHLQQDLAGTKEYLHSIIGQHLATTEELSLANEELQSTNEELQSSNEELQTAKEELQSANEELATVNEQLGRNNELLQELNDDLVNVLGSVDIAIIIVDGDRKVRRFTPKARSVMKLLPGDIGRPIADMRPSVPMPHLDEEIARVLETLEPREAEVCHPDGTWYRMQIRPYRTGENKINGATISFVDITALRAAREHAAAIVETVPTPLAVLDERLVVSSTNRAFQAAYGAVPPNTELLSLNGFRSTALRDRLREVVAKGAPFDEFDIVDDNAREPRTLRVGARRMAMFDDRPRVLVGIADVTERKRLEQARETAEGERKAFLDAVSHELRTPLSVISLWAEALRHLQPEEPDHIRAIETILDSTRMEAQLVDDLIDVALSRSTELAIAIEPVHPGPILKDVLDAIRSDADAKGVVIESDIDMTGAIAADPRRLRQIARGLISNAVKFTPDGGSIRVELSTLRGAMELRVRNSGPGLDPELLPRMFAPFVRAGDAVTAGRGGLGIGLSLVRHFVERHGGTIDIVSADAARGTTFTVRLPAHE